MFSPTPQKNITQGVKPSHTPGNKCLNQVVKIVTQTVGRISYPHTTLGKISIFYFCFLHILHLSGFLE